MNALDYADYVIRGLNEEIGRLGAERDKALKERQAALDLLAQWHGMSDDMAAALTEGNSLFIEAQQEMARMTKAYFRVCEERDALALRLAVAP